MFEAAELGSTISRDEYKKRLPALRESLLQVQRELRTTATSSAIVVLAGVDSAGRSETANLLNQWMDPRWIVTRAWREPSDEERERPDFWRYWRALPARGSIGLFINGWYGPPTRDRVDGQCGKAAFQSQLDRIATFERALAADGAIILKFFLYLDAKSQRQRLKALKKNPLTRWRVTEQALRGLELHGAITAAAEEMIRWTSIDVAPWHVVEGVDDYYRNFTVGTLLYDALRDGLDRVTEDRPQVKADRRRRKAGADGAGSALEKVAEKYTVLSALDMTQKIEKKRFRGMLAKQQGRLNLLQRQAVERGLSTVAVFEGWDAAGKGGAVRRVTAALDARDCRVIPIGAPTDEERAHHYLWRFWRHLPRAGHMTIFDRSWYGRVLVERVEQLATVEEYRRAYAEINDFEDQLVDHGILVVKFWLHITKDEQLRRFRERKRIPHNEVEDHGRRLAQPPEVGRLRACRERDGGTHEHPPRTLGAGGSERQVLRPNQGDPYAGGSSPACVEALTLASAGSRSKIAAKICCTRSDRVRRSERAPCRGPRLRRGAAGGFCRR